MTQSVQLSGAVIVSTPQDVALSDALRGLAMFQQMHVPILGVVENMSYFVAVSAPRFSITATWPARPSAAI
jgi:ATP-binding protein involved in chromosome partitioning